MKLYEFTDADYQIHDRDFLDRCLVELVRLVIEGQNLDPEKFGMVAACVLDPDRRAVARTSMKIDEKWVHAERNAMDSYEREYGEIPEGSIILTTLSPCDNPMTDRYSGSCTDYINQSPVKKVYCGYRDPSQHDEDFDFTMECTDNRDIRKLCKKLAWTFLGTEHHPVNENLHKWFKEKWVRFGPNGKIRGDCARGDDSEGKPKCLPQSKAHALGKKGRASAAARKRREDPNPERHGKAINVNTKKKSVTKENLSDNGIRFDIKSDDQNIDVRVIKDEKQIGYVIFERDGKTLIPLDLAIDKEFRGQGIAKKIYDDIKSRGFTIHRSPDQTNLGKRFWDKNKGTDKNVWEHQCPECGGAMYPETMISEKKDACYYKVKSRYKVWPSAYASGALVKCRKKGSSKWGSKSESVDKIDEKWSEKYKRSIDCSHPKGFSQRAHCAGRKKKAMSENTEELPSVSKAKAMVPQLVSRAQQDYDSWDESDKDTYAGGGICHIIADSICDVLISAGIDCSPVSSCHEQHVYVAAKFAEGVYSIDIPYHVYETGGGFSWEKLPDVKFDPGHVVFYRVSGDPNDFEAYTDSY